MSAEIIRLVAQSPKAHSNRPTEQQIRSTLYKCWAKDGLWYRTAFAHRLRLIREALHISEQDAADAMDVNLRTYRRYERSLKTRPNYDGIGEFAETFGVSLNWLFSGEGPVLTR